MIATRWERRRGIEVLAWSALEPVVDAVVTTRRGGVSTGPYGSLNLGLHVGDDPASVLANRAAAAGALGAGLGDLVLARQVHGDRVVVVGPGDAGRGSCTEASAIADADGLVTADPAPVLAVLAADCAPIVLCDPGRGVLGVAHAGWRGTVAGIAARTLEAMVALGARSDHVVAGIGPAVAPGDYQVDEAVARPALAALGPDGAALVPPDGPGHWTFDLVGANALLLAQAGVRPGHIHLAPVSTGGDGPFFSDRAERPCGRFGLLARLRGA
ncbi:MAG TPA: polyphenol oxidase family protein [Acidimicrobiales bacterium]